MTETFPTGPRPGERDTSFFVDPMIDHLLRAVVTLTQELSVTRERLQTLELSLESLTTIDRTRLDAFTPPPEIDQQRAQQRRALIDSILGPMVSRLATLEPE
ncbi:hypothetical protein [Polymorphobacter sp.]|uniref:hypothetical protein n=1 Tax=Polymorphobacter sp. TaxID=1909290 RepID=UPI003F730681